jgi:hypothetical protein
VPAKNPRVSTVVDKSLLAWLHCRAEKDGVPVSVVVRDILRRVRDDEEERYWAREGDARLASFVSDGAIAHDEAWK